MAAPPDEPISLKSAIHKLQLSLLDGIHNQNHLFAAGSLLSRTDYEDVVTERSISNACGYPLCTNPTSAPRPRKGRYRISLKEHKVYDLQESYLYCSTACVVSSRAFAEGLKPERCSVADSERISEVLRLFGKLDLNDNELANNGDLGFSDLKIEEKLDVKMGQMSMEDWIGPSNAIEGYVPSVDRSSKPSTSKKVFAESKQKSARPKTDKGKLANDLDFTSTILLGDQFSMPEPSLDSKPKGRNVSAESKRKSARPKKDKGKLANDLDFTSTILVGDQFSMPEPSLDSKPKGRNESKRKSACPKKDKGKLANDLDFTSTILVGDQFSMPELSLDSKLKGYISKLEESKGVQFINLEASYGPELNDSKAAASILAVDSQFGIPEMVYDSGENASNRGGEESKKEVLVNKKTESNEMRLNSSLKGPGAKKLARSVTWADERKTGAPLNSSLKVSGAKKLARSVTWADERKIGAPSNVKLSEVEEVGDTIETVETLSSSNEEDVDGSMRCASAEACAVALSQAAEAVASGEADVTDAVSEAGLVILPQPHDVDQYSQKDDDMIEVGLVPLKWPKKFGVLNSDVFDTEDSWYEPPPEGFSLNLSSFATMYMALFGWITSSSLAYIYGQDDDTHEELLDINGREYPHKIVLSDGRSSEIKLTLAGCLGRVLPKVATDLRLKTPISTIEKEVGHLLNTMSFVDSIPPFKLKQWHVIALLFMDALSVCRIPGLAPHMTSRQILLQKVLDGGQVSGEEYETMKDLLIPRGRVPQFSSECGA